MKGLLPLALFLALLVFPGFGLFPSPAAAQAPNLVARFSLHAIDQPTGKAPPPECPGEPDAADPVTNGIPCSDFTSARPGRSYSWVYLVIVSADQGIGGASFGVEYSGIYEPGYLSEYNWSLCSDGMSFPSETPPWPASGSGIRLFWNTCQETTDIYGINAVAAKFYMYAYTGGSFGVTPNLTTNDAPELSVITCGAVTTNLLDYYDESFWYVLMGRVDFGGGPGYLPFCYQDPTERSTWGGIKRMFTGDGDQAPIPDTAGSTGFPE
jgi:hypothetical protein